MREVEDFSNYEGDIWEGSSENFLKRNGNEVRSDPCARGASRGDSE